MSKLKKEIKNIEKNNENKYEIITFWGVVLSSVLFIFNLVAIIMTNSLNNINATPFHALGLSMGIIYLFFGIYGINKIIKKQVGEYWIIFLTGLIFSILTVLGWFNILGMIFSLFSGIMFLSYQVLENKVKLNKSKTSNRISKNQKK